MSLITWTRICAVLPDMCERGLVLCREPVAKGGRAVADELSANGWVDVEVTVVDVAFAAVDSGLAGRAVLVTGASGGIGGACAQAFIAEGARVAVHYHHGRERAEKVGGDVLVGGDLRIEADVDRIFAEARAALGRI